MLGMGILLAGISHAEAERERQSNQRRPDAPHVNRGGCYADVMVRGIVATKVNR